MAWGILILQEVEHFAHQFFFVIRPLHQAVAQFQFLKQGALDLFVDGAVRNHADDVDRIKGRIDTVNPGCALGIDRRIPRTVVMIKGIGKGDVPKFVTAQ